MNQMEEDSTTSDIAIDSLLSAQMMTDVRRVLARISCHTITLEDEECCTPLERVHNCVTTGPCLESPVSDEPTRQEQLNGVNKMDILFQNRQANSRKSLINISANCSLASDESSSSGYLSFEELTRSERSVFSNVIYDMLYPSK